MIRRQIILRQTILPYFLSFLNHEKLTGFCLKIKEFTGKKRILNMK